jgi:glycosyltransferase involved in cell wall biosynthesis
VSESLASVIVPVYNGERYLAEALESIEAQDYRPLEVIVVDDGSDDSSLAIAGAFPSVRRLRQEHTGAAAARNRGLTAARGEFISFHDADDVMVPDKLSVQVGYLVEHPEVGCVLARATPFLEPGTPPPPWLAREMTGGDAGIVYFVSAVVRRAAAARVGGFNEAYRLCDDVDWLGRLRSAGVEIAVLDSVVARRRIHSSNLTHELQPMVSERMHVLKDRIDRARLQARHAREGP